MCLGRDQSQRTCWRRFAGVTVLPVPASGLTGRSETAATESFSGISVRIATARSTTRPARSSLTRRLHSAGGCSRSTRFSGLIRASANHSAKSTIRLLLADRQQESITVHTDGFRAYEPLAEDDGFTREYVVHGDGEYADKEVHVNTCESYASLTRRWLSPHRGISTDKLTQYLRAFQLRRKLYRKPGEMHSNTLSKQLSEINNVLRKSDRGKKFPTL